MNIMRLRVYDMRINEHDETGVDINSFVDAPAHMRSFETYGKNKVMFAVDEEKRIVTGVFIMADFLIYRNDKQLGEHYVKFSPQTIWQIRNKFFKNGFQGNTNVQHALMVKGAILVDSFIVHSTDPRFPRVPEILSKQKVNDGSWVGSYYVENDALWQDCKNGIFKGFSVEGYFDKIETQIKTNMKKQTNKLSTFMRNIFGDESTEEKMAEVTTVDGLVLFYEGDLGKDTVMQVEVDGQKVTAPEGDHQITIGDKTFAITLDTEGKVTAYDEVTEMSEEATMLSAAIKKVVTDAKAKFEAYEKRIKALEDANKVLQSGGKFSSRGKKTSDEDEDEPKEKKGFRAALA